jgi:hypothetical protein
MQLQQEEEHKTEQLALLNEPVPIPPKKKKETEKDKLLEEMADLKSKVDELKIQQEILNKEIIENDKTINTIDENWQARHEQIKVDLLSSLATKSEDKKDKENTATPTVVFAYDKHGDLVGVSTEQFKEMLDTPQSPSVKEKLAQPDFKRHLDTVLQETATEEVFQQVARQNNFLEQIKLYGKMCGDDPSGPRVLEINRTNKKLRENLATLSNTQVDTDAVQIKEVFTHQKSNDEKTAKKTSNQLTIDQSEARIRQIEKNLAAIDKKETPRPTRP